MKNSYFILRHGQTPYRLKKEKTSYPWPESSPILLTQKGKKQIKVSAKKLKKEKIDLIYSSDTPRACQTAEIVARELKLKVILDSRLRDVNVGIFGGRPRKELKRYLSRPIESFSKPIPNGENWNDVRKRMRGFLKEVEKKQRNKKILIISHGDPLFLLEGTVKGWKIGDFMKALKENYIKTGELRKLC
jgi:broad specificity phosphatase PhoE